EIPAIGASGAIAGCMGAFLVCYYRTAIRLAYWWLFRFGVFEARALYALPIWFATELIMSWFEAHGVARVAHSAHVGGFAFRVAVAAGLRVSGLEKRLLSAEEAEDDWYANNTRLEEAMALARAGSSSAALGLFRNLLAERPGDALVRGEVARLALELRDFE